MNNQFPFTITGLSAETDTKLDGSAQKTALLLGSAMMVLNLLILTAAGYGTYKFATRKKKGK